VRLGHRRPVGAPAPPGPPTPYGAIREYLPTIFIFIVVLIIIIDGEEGKHRELQKPKSSKIILSI
jgi:hypothetical protein